MALLHILETCHFSACPSDALPFQTEKKKTNKTKWKKHIMIHYKKADYQTKIIWIREVENLLILTLECKNLALKVVYTAWGPKSVIHMIVIIYILK